MALRYQTGERIQAGDQIRYAGEIGTVEFATAADNPKHAYYIELLGGGCMLQVASFGSLFLSDPQDEEDLEFVARVKARSSAQGAYR